MYFRLYAETKGFRTFCCLTPPVGISGEAPVADVKKAYLQGLFVQKLLHGIFNFCTFADKKRKAPSNRMMINQKRIDTMKKYLLLLLSLLAIAIGAKADVEINSDNFPDDIFRNYLLDQEYGQDGIITDSEIALPIYKLSVRPVRYNAALPDL